MPSLPFHRRDNDGSTPFNSQSEPDLAVSEPLTTWIVVIVVVGILAGILVGLTLGFVYYQHKKAKRTTRRAPLLEPLRRRGKRKQFNHTEEEIQRRIMIRKSLASRSSHSSQSSIELDVPFPVSPKAVPCSPRVVIEEEDDEQAGTILTDWKEWEANAHRERARSGERHPLELSNPLALPPKSQDRSGSRSPLLRQHQPAAQPPPSP